MGRGRWTSGSSTRPRVKWVGHFDAVHFSECVGLLLLPPLLLFTARIGGQSLDLPDAMSVFLPDPTPEEAVQLAAELLDAAA